MADTEVVANADTDATTEDAVQTTETTEEVTEAVADEKPAEPKEADKPVVPEKYADFELPEGFQMDTKALEEFMPLAKELGMTQEAAQKAISLHAKAMGAVIQGMAEKRDSAYAQVIDEIKADKVFGGDKYEQNMGRINSVFEKFGGDANVFHQAVAQIAQYDTAKAKSMYAAFDNIAKAASVDDSLIGGGQAVTHENMADIMFPTTKSK